MRIAELSRRTGVPVPTIKYYLREGLLPPGRATAPTQALYDETHEQRLRLVRALVEVAGMSLASVRDVLAVVEHPPASRHDLLGVAHDALPPHVPDDVDVTEALAAVEQLGWRVHPDSSSLRQLAVALDAARAVGIPPTPERLAGYARAMELVASHEVAGVPAASAEEAVSYVVLGTAMYEPVILALRRLAQQDASAQRPDAD